ncbi:MAG: SPFH domain-containing protein [Bacteroidetes bacterium]|nr:SPFH domain-containing protein [Bacteroidota bacterium]
MEKITKPVNGFLALILSLLLVCLAAYFGYLGQESPFMILAATLVFIAAIFLLKGLMIIQPNNARVLSFFGKYVASVKENGLFFINPLYSSSAITLRAQNLAIPTLKVNDKIGNPIEIAAVIVWKVNDTYRATFDVSDYLNYIRLQSEAALRNLGQTFAYDHLEDESAAITLRDGGTKVNELLEKELNERLATAGLIILEARISHLAYAQEIAGAMLQRQQATAIVAARTKIVEGAVGMVEMALSMLSDKSIVTLDEKEKALMVSNLLVVLCGERGAQPVLNTSSTDTQ